MLQPPKPVPCYEGLFAKRVALGFKMPLRTWKEVENCALLSYTGCGRKNALIWEGHSFGWGARTVVGSVSLNSGVLAVFSVHHGVVGRTSSLYC